MREIMRTWFLIGLALIISCTPIKKAQENYNLGFYREAINICCVALEKDSTNADILSLLGESYFKLGILDSTLYAAGQAVELDSTSKAKELIFKIRAGYGDSLMEKQNYRIAIEEYNKALLFYPQEPHVLEQIADANYMQGRYDFSLEQYEKILPFVNDSTILLEKIGKIKQGQSRSVEKVELGLTFLNKKNYSRAKQSFEKALEIKPDNKNAKYYLYMTNGHIHYKNGKLGALWDAIKQYGHASALKPELAEPHYFMGLTYHRKDKKEYENAFREFETAIKLEPDSRFAKLAHEKLKEEQRRKKLLDDFWNNGKK